MIGSIHGLFGGGLKGLQSTFSIVNKAVGGTTGAGTVFKPVFKAVGGKAGAGSVYRSIARSTLFGKKAWMDQRVASKLAQRFSGFPISEEGLIKSTGTRISSDFHAIRIVTDTTVDGVGQFSAGCAVLGLSIIPYIVVGAGAGFVDAGIPGSIGGVFNGLVKSLTFPFRNTYRAF